ncbi:hypothetical protein EYF80_016508 [Liparis tanakae]|uniref:Uncharacterized protein n=1 Tax=Liparis tanakae TaxID=230148 RepID=A0A4Z2I7B5_9TELE|nr:hypothetical protein EYF80_016508 [Liparis tanakae]
MLCPAPGPVWLRRGAASCSGLVPGFGALFPAAELKGDAGLTRASPGGSQTHTVCYRHLTSRYDTRFLELVRPRLAVLDRRERTGVAVLTSGVQGRVRRGRVPGQRRVDALLGAVGQEQQQPGQISLRHRRQHPHRHAVVWKLGPRGRLKRRHKRPLFVLCANPRLSLLPWRADAQESRQDLGELSRPVVQVQRADAGQVRPQVSVDPRALDADQSTQVETGPGLQAGQDLALYGRNPGVAVLQALSLKVPRLPGERHDDEVCVLFVCSLPNGCVSFLIHALLPPVLLPVAHRRRLGRILSGCSFEGI